MKQRTNRLNSSLKEVISDVIHRQVRNPHIATLLTVTRVDITKDLRQAKVFISIIGTKEQKEATLQALQSAAGFIAVNASKQVVMRYFPVLTFVLDETVERQIKIDELLGKIKEERDARQEGI